MTEPSQDVPSESPTTLELTKFFFTYGIAIAVLIGYVLFVKYLLDAIDAEDESWKRMMLIFSSVEAIVFAAAGFLFGREVNKKIAEKAEKNEKDAKKDAKKAEKEKQVEREKGLTLAATVLAHEDGLDSMGSIGLNATPNTNNPVGVNPILTKVKALYPELK